MTSDKRRTRATTTPSNLLKVSKTCKIKHKDASTPTTYNSRQVGNSTGNPLVCSDSEMTSEYGGQQQHESGYSSNKAVTSSSSEDEHVGSKAVVAESDAGGVGGRFFGPGGVAAVLRSKRGGCKCDGQQRGDEAGQALSSTPPTERDVVDLLKLSFLLQAADSKPGEHGFAATPVSQDLCRELKESLKDRSLLGTCTRHVRHLPNCNCDEKKPPGATEQTLGSDPKKLPASKTCTAGPLLSDILLNLVQECLLHSLIPYLAPDKADSGSQSQQQVGTEGHDDFDSRTSSTSCSDVGTTTGEGKRLKGVGSREGAAGPAAAEGRGEAKLAPGETEGEREKRNSQDVMKSQEVTIHVCDDSRDERRDFTCPQELLLDQMGYFRDITAGQSLDDVDISVHCDIEIFEWLMLWIKSTGAEAEDGEGGNGDEEKEAVAPRRSATPVLLPSNVMSILVSASFLKIHGLVEEALRFSHQNMGKILSVMHNFNCLGEPLFSKLAYLFKASEVEDLPDRRDRLQSRLYVKLIYALCEPLPQPEREIFYTAATLYRCRACGMLLTQALSRLFPCQPLRARLSQRGEVVPQHQRDVGFNVNDFIKSLKSEVKSWRRVFWRLWGIVHPLHCSLCSSYFPSYLLAFCAFHPQDPEFPTIQFKNSTEPFGRYPCCDSGALRYQPVAPAANSGCFANPPVGTVGGPGSFGSASTTGRFPRRKGCQSRDHRVKIRTDQETSIYRILMAHRDAICLSSTRKSGIKISCDANSITLPKPSINSNSQPTFAEQIHHQQLLLMPRRRKRSLVKMSFWDIAMKANPTMQQACGLKKANSSLSLASSTVGSSTISSSTPTGPPMLNSLVQPVKFKLAARRWRNFTYGRLRRTPKMPIKQQQSSESSSAASTEDLSEDSSSSLEDEEEAGLEYEMDSKDLCIEIKAKEHHGNAGEKGKGNSGGLQGILGMNKGMSSSSTLGSGDGGGCGGSGGGGDGGGGGENGDQDGGGKTKEQEERSAARNWMRWDNERSTRANQDHQRELECSAFRTMAKLYRYRHQVQKHQQKHQQQHQQQSMRGFPNDPCFSPLLTPASPAAVASLAIPSSAGMTSSSSSHNLLSPNGRGGLWPGGGGFSSGLTTSASVPSLTALAVAGGAGGVGGNNMGAYAAAMAAAAAAAAAAATTSSAGGPGGAGGAGGAFLRLEQDWRETHMAYLQHRSGHHHHLPRTATPSVLGVPGRGSSAHHQHHHRPGSAASTRSGKMVRTGR